ncbi:MAG: hypothetical protein IIX01_01445, partial [Clostridia bacterium]|nr:hypothetical protein [Clostridia bacterium]
GCINVHASLLPRYRGAAPIQWAVLNGEPETGVTTMCMDVGLDTGDMLLKSSCPITEDMTAGELHDALSVQGAALLSDTLKALEKEAENFKAEREKYLSAEKAEKPTESEKEISSAQNLAEEPAFVSVPPEQVGQTAVGVSNDGEAEIGETKVENPKIGADSPETVSEETRLKIVREYLESLRGGGVPVSKNGGTLGGAAVKVKSVKEAGNMALRFFKNNQNQ